MVKSTSEGEMTMWGTACVSRTSGKNEPAHYMFKIESFSLLSESGDVEIESHAFEAAGHKWRLKLYPNGNDEEEIGGNHIFLYLEVCETESLAKGWDVHVYFRLFVYDHIRHNYLIIQVPDGERTRFHEKKTKWGFPNLISLDSFKDPENGYLFKDSCVFGAEVFVVPKYAHKYGCLTMIKPPSSMNTHIWRIEKFSAITEEPLNSEDFKISNVIRKLRLYPKGVKEGKGTYLSIFLHIHEADLLPTDSKVFANCKFHVKNQVGGASIDEEFVSWYVKSSGRGYPCFMLLSELKDLAKGFLMNDTLIIEAKVSIVGILKDSI